MFAQPFAMTTLSVFGDDEEEGEFKLKMLKRSRVLARPVRNAMAAVLEFPQEIGCQFWLIQFSSFSLSLFAWFLGFIEFGHSVSSYWFWCVQVWLVLIIGFPPRTLWFGKEKLKFFAFLETVPLRREDPEELNFKSWTRLNQRKPLNRGLTRV